MKSPLQAHTFLRVLSGNKISHFSDTVQFVLDKSGFKVYVSLFLSIFIHISQSVKFNCKQPAAETFAVNRYDQHNSTNKANNFFIFYGR